MSQTIPQTFVLTVPNRQGGDPLQLFCQMDSTGLLIINGVSVSGLNLNTSGVTDSTNKRFVTDAQLTEIQNLTNLLSEQLLSSTPNVNLNSASATSLYTVPAAKSCVITKVVVRNASTSLTTASIAFGFNSPSFNNVIATATHTELTGNTLYSILSAKAGSTVGVAADVFSVLPTILQGAAATVTIDVYGYLF